MNCLKELRDAAGLSQEELAELVGTSQAQINRLETGKREMTLAWAQRLGTALRVSWTRLLPRDELGFDPATLAMLDLFAEMNPDQRDAIVRLAATMAKPGNSDGRDDDRKKAG